MARDRQRSKARQRARAAGDQPTPRKRDRKRARDDDQTPDELEGATPYVDEAHLAEAGAEVPPPTDGADTPAAEDDLVGYDDEPDFDRADDEVEIPRDLVANSEREALPHDDKERGRVLSFLRACVTELQRVQWPDRKHVFQATAVVLGFVLIAGSYLGLMDAVWQPLINAIL